MSKELNKEVEFRRFLKKIHCSGWMINRRKMDTLRFCIVNGEGKKEATEELYYPGLDKDFNEFVKKEYKLS